VLQDDWLSLKIQVCPASLLRWLRQDLSPLTSSATLSNAKTWLPHLQAIMVDPVNGFRGLLSHFTPAQINCIDYQPRGLLFITTSARAPGNLCRSQHDCNMTLKDVKVTVSSSVISVTAETQESTRCGVSRGNRHNCCTTWNSFGVCTLVSYIHGLGQRGRWAAF